jgi:hypothetical protein
MFEEMSRPKESHFYEVKIAKSSITGKQTTTFIFPKLQSKKLLKNEF